jgi:hypothetical protein
MTREEATAIRELTDAAVPFANALAPDGNPKGLKGKAAELEAFEIFLSRTGKLTIGDYQRLRRAHAAVEGLGAIKVLAADA